MTKKLNAHAQVEADKSQTAAGELVADTAETPAQAQSQSDLITDDWLLGHMDVKSRSHPGFWRCGHYFPSDICTRVMVVNDIDLADEGVIGQIAVSPIYVTVSDAMCIRNEPWLQVEIDEQMRLFIEAMA